MRWFALACLVGLYYLACLGVDSLPWNKDKKKEEE